MKKSFSLLALMLALGLTGCTQTEPTPMYVEGDETECSSCGPSAPTVKSCANKTKTINYVDKCSGGCGFPVTVRKVSDCQNGGAM